MSLWGTSDCDPVDAAISLGFSIRLHVQDKPISTSLLNIVGVAPTNATFFFCFCFLSSETLDDYCWALGTFRRLLNANHLPAVMVTDREMALINAIEQTIPNTKHLLCKWHFEKNILAKCRKHFSDDDHGKQFIQHWNIGESDMKFN